MNKKLQMGLVSLSAIGLLAACGNNADTNDTTPEVEKQEESMVKESVTKESITEESSTEVVKNSAADSTGLTLQPEEAFDIYGDKYPNAKITQVQLNQDMGNFVYKIEGFEGTTEYEMKIDPSDGTILKESTDTDNDIDEKELTREQVEKVMDLVDKDLANAEEGTLLKEWTIDEDNGLVKLEVELNQDGFDDQEHTYNIETGELMEMGD